MPFSVSFLSFRLLHLWLIFFALIVFSFYFALRRQVHSSTALLALAVVLFVHPIIFLIPLLVLHNASSSLSSSFTTTSSTTTTATMSLPRRLALVVVSFFAYLSAFLCLSYCLAGFNWQFINYYKFYFLISDLTPNLGIFWYLFIEMLKAFPLLFLTIFHSFSLFMPIPIAIRFR